MFSPAEEAHILSFYFGQNDRNHLRALEEEEENQLLCELSDTDWLMSSEPTKPTKRAERLPHIPIENHHLDLDHRVRRRREFREYAKRRCAGVPRSPLGEFSLKRKDSFGGLPPKKRRRV